MDGDKDAKLKSNGDLYLLDLVSGPIERVFNLLYLR